MTTSKNIELLFRTHYKVMFALAKRLLHEEETARDIVHDVFTSILAEQPETVSPAYLLEGVRMRCLKLLRSLSIRERLNKLYAIELDEIEDEVWPDEEEINHINTMIDTLLPEMTKKIVRLRYNKQMKYKEIAECLNISEVAIYKHLRHAMNVLRQNLNTNER